MTRRIRLIPVILLLAFGKEVTYAQNDLIEKLIRNYQERLDTSEYVPYIYSDALEYNLMIAASKGYPSEAERLLKKGADVNRSTGQGVTPLILAVSNNKPETVDVILSYNPEIDAVTTSNETALLIAAKAQYFTIAEKLIRAGANISFADRYGATALHYSASYGYPDITDLLLYYDAPADVKSNDGNTPLHTAVWAGYIEVTDLLIQHGVNLNERNNDGLTPFLLAAYLGDTVLMDMLHKGGADINIAGSNGMDALSLAIMSGQDEAARYIVKSGFRINRRTTDPYVVASKYGQKDMIEWMTENKVEGKAGYSINQVSLSLSSRATVYDLFTGFSLSFREPLLQAGFTAGIDTKIWRTRILVKESREQFYQYWNRSSLVYAGLFRDFPLKGSGSNTTLYFTASVLAGYSFGENLRGTYIPAESNLKIIPSAALKWNRQNLTIQGGFEYINTGYYRNGPLWFRLGLGYNYYLDNLRFRIKPPRWF